jgi:hypothetical protein
MAPTAAPAFRPALEIVRHRAEHRLVGTALDGHRFTVEVFPTKARAARALARLDRLNQADALALDAAEEAILRVQRAAGVPRRDAIEALRDTVSDCARTPTRTTTSSVVPARARR